MKAKKKILKEKLPTYTAPVDMWDNIEKQLDLLEEAQIDKHLIAKLPTYTAPDVFNKIAPPPKIKTLNANFMRIAASIILLIGFSFGFSQLKNRTKTKITYSMEAETSTNSNENIALFTYESDFNSVLNQKCKTRPGVCDKKEFDELFSQLKDIEREEQVLQEAIKEYKSDELLSHLIRLTNDKIKLENYILELFS